MAGRIDTPHRREQSTRHQSSPRSPHHSSSIPPHSPQQQAQAVEHNHHSFSRRLIVPMLRPNIRNAFSQSHSPPSSPSTFSPLGGISATSPRHQGSPRQRSRGVPSSPLSSDMAHMSPNRKAVSLARAQARAQKENDSMVYLDGPQVYTCAQCRTHLTSHDDIISKSFHGRHGRAYLFDHCVNVTTGPAEDRLLITGLHSVCDIFCKRCKRMVGWTYSKAYEASQKYKEGKFIIEKINLHMEESFYDVRLPAGERQDRWRRRSMSWGNGEHSCDLVYEYRPASQPQQHVGGAPSPGASLVTGDDDGDSVSKGTTSIAIIGGGNIVSPPTPPFL